MAEKKPWEVTISNNTPPLTEGDVQRTLESNLQNYNVPTRIGGSVNPLLDSQKRALKPLIVARAGENLTAGQYVIIKTQATVGDNSALSTSIASDDARVNQASAGTNYASDTTAVLGADAGGNANWVFLKWNVSSSDFPTVAERCFIRLKWSNHNGLGGITVRHPIRAYRVTGADWSESTITWTNKPAVSASPEEEWDVTPNDSITIFDPIFNNSLDAGKWVFIDITTLYNLWKSGGASNYGVALRLVSSGTGSEAVDVRITDLVTSENTTVKDRPSLVFTGIQSSYVGYAYKAKSLNRDLTIGVKGFVLSDATFGNTVPIQIGGTVLGLSGLTTGAVYYMSSNAGEIIKTARTQRIGVAISATELLMDSNQMTEHPYQITYTCGGAAAGNLVDANYLPVFTGIPAQVITGIGTATAAGTTVVAHSGFNNWGYWFSLTGTTYTPNTVGSGNGDLIIDYDGAASTFCNMSIDTAITTAQQSLAYIFGFYLDGANDNTIKSYLTHRTL